MATLTGVVPPIGTPLTDGDRVDEAGLRRLTQYLLGAGVDGIFTNGSMGGFAFLTDDEQLRAIATVAAEVNNTVPVMAGVGETSTVRAVQKAKLIAREGVDFLSLLAPFYYPPTQEQLIAYFSEIAAAVDLPIFIYDNPGATKTYIHPETVALLREQIPHFVGVKESNQDCVNLQKLIELNQVEGFSIMTGSEFLIVVGMQMGCSGFVGGLHNICPQIAVALYRAFHRGDLEQAKKLQRDLTAVWQIFRYGSIWGAFDEALRYLGIAQRATGAPYITKLSHEETGIVHDLLDQYVKPYLVATVS
ncbi:MAG: dihydrodipicolinate synthase family protein [Acidobacteria bacterium]|nr:dihydrodipicolinate synthase family protein [Acidobacteriota bacterium]